MLNFIVVTVGTPLFLLMIVAPVLRLLLGLPVVCVAYLLGIGLEHSYILLPVVWLTWLICIALLLLVWAKEIVDFRRRISTPEGRAEAVKAFKRDLMVSLLITVVVTVYIKLFF